MQAQRIFKTAPLYAVTNPEPTATPEILALFTSFFESLWSPITGTTAAAEKAGMSYVYDEDGTLIAQTLTGGATTTWGQSARYIYLPTASGPMPVSAIYGTKHYAIQSDHLNTPRRLIQSDGQVAWQWGYSAFGDEKPTIARNRFANTDLNQSFGTAAVAAVTFNLRYPGQYFDQESNLHYNLNRSYCPGCGRYTQSDPIDLQGGWNKFGYSNQNPLSFTDPNGLQVASTAAGAAAGGLGGIGGVGGSGSNQSFVPPSWTKPSPLLPTWNGDGVTWPNWMGMAGTGSQADDKKGVPEWNKNPPIQPGQYSCRYVMYFPEDQCKSGQCPPFVTGRGWDVTLLGAMLQARTEAQSKIPPQCAHQHHGQMWCRFGGDKPFMPGK